MAGWLAPRGEPACRSTLDNPGGEAGAGVAEHLAVADGEGADPALLAEGQGNEEAQLDQLGLAELAVQLGPEGVVGQGRVVRDGFGPGERGLLARAITVGLAEAGQIGQRILGDALLFGPNRALHASVVAVHEL